jgi:hypothetical protein
MNSDQSHFDFVFLAFKTDLSKGRQDVAQPVKIQRYIQYDIHQPDHDEIEGQCIDYGPAHNFF